MVCQVGMMWRSDVPLGRLRPSDVTTRGARGRGGGHSGTALRAGEVDFANYVPREHVERLSRAPEITVLRRRDTQGVASYFNLSKRPFYGAQVRRAILGYGMDRQAIVKTALLGLAQPL